MGGDRHLHVRRRRSLSAARQGPGGIPIGLSRRRLARLVDPGADRRREPGRSSRRGRHAGRATGRTFWRTDRRGCDCSGHRGIRVRGLALQPSARHLDRHAPLVRRRRNPRGIPHAAAEGRTEAAARFRFPRRRGRRRAGRGGRPRGNGEARKDREVGVYSTCTLASLMTLPHFARSASMRSPNFSGELTIEKAIAGARNLSRNAASLKIFCVSALSLSTMSRGVPFGATKPYHAPASWPGRLSAMVGTLGNSASRAALPKPMSFGVPASKCLRTKPMLTMIIWIWPPSTSVIVGLAPL